MSLKNLSAKIKIPNLLKKKLSNKRVKQIYKKFEKSLNINENFVVAVSGGPDSLALSFLAYIYSIKKKLKSKFLIVDHKLRPESTNEANKVKQVLKKNFIESKILTWEGKKPSKNIQSNARKKRYEMLFSECDKFRIVNILLGHHQDDLFENFFIRIQNMVRLMHMFMYICRVIMLTEILELVGLQRHALFKFPVKNMVLRLVNIVLQIGAHLILNQIMYRQLLILKILGIQIQ